MKLALCSQKIIMSTLENIQNDNVIIDEEFGLCIMMLPLLNQISRLNNKSPNIAETKNEDQSNAKLRHESIQGPDAPNSNEFNGDH